REHLLLTGRAVAHDDFTVMPVRRSRGVEEHGPPVGALGAGVEIRVHRVPAILRRGDADLYAAAPRRERVVCVCGGMGGQCREQGGNKEREQYGFVHDVGWEIMVQTD